MSHYSRLTQYSAQLARCRAPVAARRRLAVSVAHGPLVPVVGSRNVSCVTDTAPPGVGCGGGHAPTPAAAARGEKHITLTIDAAKHWAGLISAGVYASGEAIGAIVIGRGGATRHALAEASGAASITVAGPRIAIVGTPAAAARARAGVEALIVPMATIDIARVWGRLISDGVHASAAAILRLLFGDAGVAVHALEGKSGARVWQSVDGMRLFIAGGASSVAHARTALYEAVEPAVTIDVGARWAGLIQEQRVYSSPRELLKVLIGPRWGRASAIARVSGARVWADWDRCRIFLSGGPGALSAACAAIDAAVTPVVTIDIADRWEPLLDGGGMYASVEALLARLLSSGAAGGRGFIDEAAGARVWASADRCKLHLSGTPDAVAAALTALDARVAPAATIDVAAILCSAGGDHAVAACMAATSAVLRSRTAASARARGAVAWSSVDGAAVYLSGDPGAVAAARPDLGAALGEWAAARATRDSAARAAASRAAAAPAPGTASASSGGDSSGGSGVSPSQVVVHAGEAWRGLLEQGVYASVAAIADVIMGPRGARRAALERTTGASIAVDRRTGGITLSGTRAATRAARSALESLVVPARIDVVARWPRLFRGGVYSSLDNFMGVLCGHRGQRMREIETRSGAVVWRARNTGHLFLSGADAAVARALLEIESLVVPAATIDVGAEWGGLISSGVHASPADLLHILNGPHGARRAAIQRACGVTMHNSDDFARVYIAGRGSALAAARAAVAAVVVPVHTIDVAGVSGGAVSAWVWAAAPGGGVSAGAGGALSEFRTSPAACVWHSVDGARVYVSGTEPAAVARAHAAVLADIRARAA